MMIRTPIAACAAAVLLATAAPAAPAQQAPVDPALNQRVDADETIAPEGEQATIDAGHVDLGPMLDPADGLLARDDTSVPPVWRHLDDVVLRVGDEAAQQLPDGDEFSFTGALPGDTVWVVPQTEVAGVPWLGWNTQSPSLLGAAAEGVTFEFAGHQGPGQFSLFLQNGGFEPPQVLWDSAAECTQPFWAELNTHTHANWVFTEPGIHKVALKVTAPLADGTELTDTQVLTFAVGDGTDPAEAHATEWDGEMREAAPDEASTQKDASVGAPVWLIAAGALLLAVVAAAVVALRRTGVRR